jgi:hypothetical protein
MIWRLPSEASPSAVRLRPRPAVFVFRGGGYQGSVLRKPAPLPLDPRKPLVRQVGFVAVSGYEGIPYGPFVGGGRGQTEGAHHALGVHYQRHLEAVDPP